MKEIHSNIIGKLIQNARFKDWWESSPIEIPFFDNLKLKITYIDFLPENDKEFISETDDALKYFLEKSESDRLSISNLVYKNCTDFLNEIGYNEDDKKLWEIKDQNEIWEFVHPIEIYISRRRHKDKNIYIEINCECEWEDEHGLLLVFRKGKQITRVSQIDGHITEADAYDISDSEDILLSQFVD